MKYLTQGLYGQNAATKFRKNTFDHILKKGPASGFNRPDISLPLTTSFIFSFGLVKNEKVSKKFCKKFRCFAQSLLHVSDSAVIAVIAKS